MADLDLDLAGYSGSDQFLFAYNVDNANVASLRYRLITDSSNYYDFNFGAQTAGYKIASLNKSGATVTGSPDWANITSIQVTTTASAAGLASVEFDAIRIEDVDTLNPDYALVARKVLSTPLTKLEGRALEFEYALSVNV